VTQQAALKTRSANRRSSASRGRAATNGTARWNPGVSSYSVIVHVPEAVSSFPLLDLNLVVRALFIF